MKLLILDIAEIRLERFDVPIGADDARAIVGVARHCRQIGQRLLLLLLLFG
jgi:hypothetical protein